MSLFKKIAAAVSLCIITSAVYAQNLPDGIAFVGYDSETWSIYYIDDGSQQLKQIKEIKHPRNFTWNRRNNKIAYISVDSKLVEFDMQSKKEQPFALISENDQVTQPKYSVDQKRLFAVLLPNGKSRKTQLIEFQKDKQRYESVVRKRTAQFEPFMFDDEYLYYTTAICVNDCGNMIWELWRRDMSSAEQVQLTLGNHVSRQPVLKDKDWIYFSSNRAGNYHIWRMKNKIGAAAEQLTSGDVHDSDINFDNNGNLYFLRRSQENIEIMKLSKNKLTEIKLPEHIIDIRNLEVRP